ERAVGPPWVSGRAVPNLLVADRIAREATPEHADVEIDAARYFATPSRARRRPRIAAFVTRECRVVDIVAKRFPSDGDACGGVLAERKSGCQLGVEAPLRANAQQCMGACIRTDRRRAAHEVHRTTGSVATQSGVPGAAQNLHALEVEERRVREERRIQGDVVRVEP